MKIVSSEINEFKYTELFYDNAFLLSSQGLRYTLIELHNLYITVIY